MAIEVKQQKNGLTYLTVCDEMTIYTVREQKQQLLSCLKSAEELQIDLGGVSEIDSAGVQLLMFIKQEAVNRKIKLSLLQHSRAVVEVLELLNLSKYFGDPIVISADWPSP